MGRHELAIIFALVALVLGIVALTSRSHAAPYVEPTPSPSVTYDWTGAPTYPPLPSPS